MIRRAIITVLILIPSLIFTGLVIRWIKHMAPRALGFQLPDIAFVILFIGGFSIVFSLVVGPFFKSVRKISRIELSRGSIENSTLGSGSESSQLILSRAHSYIDRLRAYQVHIDGMPAGQILDGTKKTYMLDPGDHEIALQIDWCGSAPIKFHLNSGERKYLSCGPSLDGIRFLLLPWYVTFGRNQYIRLKWQ